MSNTQVLRPSHAAYVKAALWWRVNHQPGQDTGSAAPSPRMPGAIGRAQGGGG